jgi:hypothetical protein
MRHHGTTGKLPRTADNLRKYLESRQPIDPVAKFWSLVDKNGPIPEHCPELGSCWVWMGALNARGYGRTYLGGGRKVKLVLAHRFSWKIAKGGIPAGLGGVEFFDLAECEHLEYACFRVEEGERRETLQYRERGK